MNADEAVDALIAGEGTAEDVVAALLPFQSGQPRPPTPIGMDVEIDPTSPAFRLYSGYVNGRVSREDYTTIFNALKQAENG